MSVSKNFCFTLNNYTEEQISHLDELDCQYIIYGKEVAPLTGTPHLQGFIVFNSSKRLKAAVKLLPGSHVSLAKGNSKQNIAYCSKEGKFTVRGEPPLSQGDSNRAKYDYCKILAAAKTGDVSSIPDEILFRHPKLVASHREFILTDTEEENLWYYGKTGCGKSRKARSENPGAYLKMCNKWWDGYAGQDTVIIEDFDKDHKCLCHHLKIWADRYCFPAEIKGHKLDIRPRRIIVTSNFSPEEIWEDEKDLEPILRRFKTVHFNNSLFVNN